MGCWGEDVCTWPDLSCWIDGISHTLHICSRYWTQGASALQRLTCLILNCPLPVFSLLDQETVFITLQYRQHRTYINASSSYQVAYCLSTIFHEPNFKACWTNVFITHSPKLQEPDLRKTNANLTTDHITAQLTPRSWDMKSTLIQMPNSTNSGYFNQHTLQILHFHGNKTFKLVEYLV